MPVVESEFVKLPRHLEGVDLYNMLSVEPGANRATVDTAYRNVEHPTFVHYTAWKLLRDKAYAQLYKQSRSITTVIDAGFIVDKIDINDSAVVEFDAKEFTTPVYKIAANLEGIVDDLPYVVLLTTGAFSPLHYGHISMMETAKKTLESIGRHVVGGYISPSHDDYVSTKYRGDASLSAPHRIHIARRAVDSSDWLMVDPWEGDYAPTDVNFTDVISRLQNYLRFCFPGKPIEVYYVFGADNADFARVLRYTDGGICVSRSSSFNPRPGVFTEQGIADNSRLIFVRSDDPASDFSSTAVRRWKPQLMPKDASIDYFNWKKTLISDDLDVPLPPQNYIIRDDLSWALAHYFPKSIPEDVNTAATKFKQGLKDLIESAYAEATLPDRSREIRVYFYDQADQYTVAKAIERSGPTLNLDTATNDGNGINFSRRFEMADSQFRPSGLIARPGFPAIEDQIASISPGEYTFLDDDIASGATLNLLMGLLPEDVTIKSIKTLFSHSRRVLSESNQLECLDVVDTRDFLLGCKAGGLVVGAPIGDGLVRVPYAEPFVNLNSRAFIPLSRCRSFSIGVWQLNYDFFSSINMSVTVQDATSELQDLLKQIGFNADTPLTDIAKYYIDHLQKDTQLEPIG